MFDEVEDFIFESATNVEPSSTLIVHFASKEDRINFSHLVGQHLHLGTKAIWHPKTGDALPPFVMRNDEGTILGDEEQESLGLDDGADWQHLWRGMPRYEHADVRPDTSLLVHFKTPTDRVDFLRLVDQDATERTKSIWYPEAVIGTAADKVWTSTLPRAAVTPRHPIYIISKGRWESRMTSKALEWTNVPYHIVIEPQEYDQYARVIDPLRILILPFSNLGLGGIPARNWVWEHAIAAGAERHWILDDNISGFCRFVDNLKVEVDSGVAFRAIEDWVDRYENVKMAAFNYDYFAPRKMGAKIKPITLNTRCYSGILLSNDLPHRWRGRYNEDTDLSLRILKDGWCTALFNAFLMYKQPTLKMKGGNTDQLYAGVEATTEAWQAHCAICDRCRPDESPMTCIEGRAILAKDGRWLMADSLYQQHPYETTVERKWRRWQHQVDYRAFNPRLGLNVLKPRSDVIIPDEPNEYGMTLVPMPQEHEPLRDVPRERRRQPAAPNVPGPSALAFALDDGPVELPEPRLPDPEPEPLAARPSLAPVGPEKAMAEALDLAISNPGQPMELPEASPESASAADFGAAIDELEEPEEQSLAQFLSVEGISHASVDEREWKPDELPRLDGIDELVLNFATDGTDWRKGHRPVGLTIAALDGSLIRFLPFRFAGGNLDEAQVKAWAKAELRGKKIVNVNTRFDMHMAREWGVDLDEQGCGFSDVMHSAALLDDHRKRFALDVLIADYLPGEPTVSRVDETQHHRFHAAQAAEREKYTATAVCKLRDEMWPEMVKQELLDVQQIEDDVIPAVVEMEKNGAPLDVPLLQQYQRECMTAYGDLMLAIAKECGFAFEHTAKGWQRLIERLVLPMPDSFDEAALNLIDHPLVRMGQKASQHASLNSKVFKPYLEAVSNGMLYYDINQLRGDDGGTVSGRFSIGYVQQVPNHDNHHAAFGDLWFPRRLFIPRVGQVFEADAAQIEYRILAHLANNPKILAEYARDPSQSFHKMTWAMIKQYKPDMLYSDQKSFNFARQYGGRTIKLATMMGYVTEKEGAEIRQAKRWNDPRLKVIQEIEAAYKQMMPEGEALLEQASHLAKPECDDYCRRNDRWHKEFPHRGYVRTLKGRRSRFPNNYKTYIGLNRVIQGTGADIMKMKLAALHKARKETGLVMRLTIHDAVMGDATTPETQAKVDAILAEQSIQLRVPILWESGVGKNWAECKG
jgi:DNA polymerase I-like protein with 3'-5' exonuclease and polymerase domains